MSKRKGFAVDRAHEEELALYLAKQAGWIPEHPERGYPYGNARAQSYIQVAQGLLRDWSSIRRAALRRHDRGLPR